MDFREIYDHYYHPVRRFISKMVGDEWAADDLTQDTFIKVQQNLNGLREPAKLKPWIFQIARNRCLDHFRNRPVQSENKELPSGSNNAIAPVAQLQVEQDQMSRCVQDKVHMLPEPLRVALILYDTLGMGHQEIADTLNISIGNAKVRVHRARKALREVLQRDCTFEHDERNVMVCLPGSEDTEMS